MSQQFVRQATLFRIPWVTRPSQPPPPPPPETSAPPAATTQDPKAPPPPLQRQLSSTEIQIQSVPSQEYSRPSSPVFQPSQLISSQPTNTSPTKTSTTSPSAPLLEDSSPPVNGAPAQTPDQSLPTTEAVPQSALPPDQSSGQQQLPQSTSPSTETLSANGGGDASPALPKTQAEVSDQPSSQPEEPTQMKANTELDGAASKREGTQLGEMEMERLNSIKPQESPSPSQSRNQSTRETSSPPRSPAKLETPTSSRPSSPTKQVSHLEEKSMPSSETQPPNQTTSETSSPSRLPANQPEQSTNKDTLVQPLPLPSPVLAQALDPKEQSSPNPQLSQALEQTQMQKVTQSDRETQELTQEKTPAINQPTPTAVPDIPFPSRSQEHIHVPTRLNDEPPKSEIDDGKPEIESEAKTKDILASPADDEPKRRTTAKIPNMEIESNKHAEGQSDIKNQADKEKKDKQPTRNKSEMAAATAFQAIEGEGGPTLHAKKKTAESWSHTKSSALQREQASFNKDVNEGFSRYAHKLVQGLQNRTLDGNPASVTALCGANTGASMHMGSENPKTGQSNIAGEVHAKEESELNLRRSHDFLSREVKASKTYVNNNVQGVNNSILHTSSIRERTPGVHLAFSHQPTESLNMNSAPQNVTAVEKDDSQT
ncbi:hypothetical protein Scep_020612 [Stephania cephalantha]|uniref:Uncharacterized protein n=1 Tax=Stephania cephalantha TaxID=152367 RepID=A0AAP0NNC2_9MAGN